jgi:hypothetical protein
MSFLRRISNAANAILPTLPNSRGVPAPHVPRRATETFTTKQVEDPLDDDASSRASWELSETSSIRSGSSSPFSASERSGSSYESDDSEASSDSELDHDGRPRDRYDMMVRHLWNVADRQGWFRDANLDGIVSIRWACTGGMSLIA